MQHRKRSREEMYHDVLDMIRNGTHLRTRIMYRANLSWRPLMEILDMFIHQGLIEANPSKNGKRVFYELTDEGNETLGKLSRVIDWRRRIEGGKTEKRGVAREIC